MWPQHCGKQREEDHCRPTSLAKTMVISRFSERPCDTGIRKEESNRHLPLVSLCTCTDNIQSPSNKENVSLKYQDSICLFAVWTPHGLCELLFLHNQEGHKNHKALVSSSLHSNKHSEDKIRENKINKRLLKIKELTGWGCHKMNSTTTDS